MSSIQKLPTKGVVSGLRGARTRIIEGRPAVIFFRHSRNGEIHNTPPSSIVANHDYLSGKLSLAAYRSPEQAQQDDRQPS
jgi:hypothetical protein